MSYELPDRSLKLPDSIALLWIGSVLTSAPISFMAGSAHVLNTVKRYLTDGELEGGKGFALGILILFAMVIALFGFVCLSIGFALSLRRDHRPLFSLPHFCALASLAVPVAMIILIRS